MPFCMWCRRFIEKTSARWRCEECLTIYCDLCSARLSGNCPFCIREKSKEKTLKKQIPIVS